MKFDSQVDEWVAEERTNLSSYKLSHKITFYEGILGSYKQDNQQAIKFEFIYPSLLKFDGLVKTKNKPQRYPIAITNIFSVTTVISVAKIDFYEFIKI